MIEYSNQIVTLQTRALTRLKLVSVTTTALVCNPTLFVIKWFIDHNSKKKEVFIQSMKMSNFVMNPSFDTCGAEMGRLFITALDLIFFLLHFIKIEISFEK